MWLDDFLSNFGDILKYTTTTFKSNIWSNGLDRIN